MKGGRKLQRISSAGRKLADQIGGTLHVDARKLADFLTREAAQ